ncbi:MAG: D-glycero-beta-D-manno-heptose 1,7-bisphosphate 7-phosphatase [Tatlockia sp.]|jgi:D-glycero-D-manno-heptose 1,7-bisphosphate phosphatase
MNKIILLDRDGVINQDSWNYIKSAEEFIPVPGSIEAIARLTEAGYRIGVATNQSGISRGYYDEEKLAAIHGKMHALVQEAGGNIDAIEYCVHLPESGCACRKPEPGMLLALGERLKSPIQNVPFIGDRVSDVQAALAVGAAPMVVLSPMTDRDSLKNYQHVPVFDSLALCVDNWLAQHD